MTERNFVLRREAFWQEFEKMIRGSRSEIKAGAANFPRQFRELTQDLNTARAHGFAPEIIERLNILINEGNQILYSQRSWSLKGPLRFILRTFPQKVRSQWRGIGAVMLIFYGLAFFFAFLTIRFPDLAAEFIPETQLVQLEEMYDPSGGNFLVPRDVASDADMFGFYIYNNISIAFRVFAGGILAGIGSLLILCFNGVFMGAAAGHIINKGFGETFFPFIIAHSSFELTAIVFSAQGGFLLGYRLFITRGLSRGASLRAAGRDVLPIIAGSGLLLVLAAVIEAFWSSRHEFPLALRYGAGAAGWVLLLLYFLLAGRPGKS
ncbi:MAG: stage II sporulation protein M [Treponema sp.]|jgi:uncharacterized membrane protein SpoIIM required for sporulation|nr:stage II sporulation protein M [Treponema sp.]